MTRPFACAALGLSAVLTMLAASVPLASAAPSAAQTIAARQANFKKIGGAMKTIKDQVASGAVDKPAALAAAKTVADLAKAQKGLFPAGSGPSSGAKTDALPAVWTAKPGFDAQMAKFAAEADKLVLAANTGNAAALGAQFKVVGGTCAACHKQFRADN
ncbi:cytochrome c signal peptide protein [Novosphingobium sp. Rr 2-17]|uniref:c-type cytochrome n=1 Tax=Novosphingobium sp. Rr 2-17 TaxID=555793 RepID=UPI000269980F|nr:cytochrome c [Novosphingobium sp. Rr 2-17]EIZ81055.1 cytochrome c signal peptide protein [Novosphingobium sp. Rr 2-17]